MDEANRPKPHEKPTHGQAGAVNEAAQGEERLSPPAGPLPVVPKPNPAIPPAEGHRCGVGWPMQARWSTWDLSLLLVVSAAAHERTIRPGCHRVGLEERGAFTNSSARRPVTRRHQVQLSR